MPENPLVTFAKVNEGKEEHEEVLEYDEGDSVEYCSGSKKKPKCLPAKITKLIKKVRNKDGEIIKCKIKLDVFVERPDGTTRTKSRQVSRPHVWQYSNAFIR